MESKEVKNILEDSKAKLAAAFDRLEALFAEKVKLRDTSEIEAQVNILKQKLALMTEENQNLTQDFNILKDKYEKSKKVNSEVLSELDFSIEKIESLMNNVVIEENANSNLENK